MFTFQHKKAPWYMRGGMLSTQTQTSNKAIKSYDESETKPKKEEREEDDTEGVEETKDGSTEPKVVPKKDTTPLAVIQKEFQKANPTVLEEYKEKPQLSVKDKETRIKKLAKFITTGKLEKLINIKDNDEFETALQNYIKTELPALINENKEVSDKDLFNLADINNIYYLIKNKIMVEYYSSIKLDIYG